MPDTNYFINSGIDLSDLPAVQTEQFIPIERSYRKILYIINSITFVVLLILLLGFVGFVSGLFHWLTYALLLVWFFLILFSLWFASASTAHKSYLLRHRDISYRSGVFFRDWITVPFSRVQHCELSRGVLDRSFGLAELRVYTAGGSSSDISIPGLKNEVALQLKDFIISKIKDSDEEE